MKLLEEAAEQEMQLFDAVETEYPTLREYRDKIYEQFLKHFRCIVDYGKYSHRLLLWGAIMRSLNYYRGALWSLGTRNTHVFYDCLRAQCETLALTHYCVLKPDYVLKAMAGKWRHKEEEWKITNILTMMEELDEKPEYSSIKKQYDGLCHFVHPNPESLYANVKLLEKTKDEEQMRVMFSTKNIEIDDSVAKKYIQTLICWTDWLFDELSRLVKSTAN